MGRAFAGAWRRIGSIGLVPTLLGTSLLAVVIAVTVLQGWTLHIVRQSEEHDAQSQLEVSLAVLKEELHHIGSDWRLTEDGKLLLDGKAARLETAVDAVGRLTHAVATVFAGDRRVATTIRGADGARATGTTLAAGAAREAVITGKSSYRGSAVILGIPHITVYEPLLDADGRQIGILFVGVPSTNVQAVIARIIWQSSMAALLVVLIVGIGSWLMLRASLRPLKALAWAVRTIGDGQLDIHVPCANRTDQLGEIGRAVAMLREKAKHAHALDVMATEDSEIKGRRQKAMDQLTQDFGMSVSGVLVGLVSSAEGMRGSATEMVDVAELTRKDMATTTSDAEMSSQNLSRIAAAAEELTASVGEISRQVAETTEAAGEAVVQATATDITVRELSAAATEIGQIVGLISTIAAQTNLLALNATIEAARAGEAGKGFAVVAGEVKQLAAQTAHATSNIGRKVSAIQAATGEAANAVRGVSAAIARLSQGANTISAAVMQQGLATHEIAGQVSTVAGAMDKAARAMLDVSSAAERSGKASRLVLASADHVTRISTTLRNEVDHFVGAMRRSEGSDNRRSYERIPGGDATATLRCEARSISARIIDISLGGAAFSCEWPCEAGTAIMLRFAPGGPEISSRVVVARDNRLAVAFQQDPDGLGHVAGAMKAIMAQAKSSGRPLAA